VLTRLYGSTPSVTRVIATDPVVQLTLAIAAVPYVPAVFACIAFWRGYVVPVAAGADDFQALTTLGIATLFAAPFLASASWWIYRTRHVLRNGVETRGVVRYVKRATGGMAICYSFHHDGRIYEMTARSTDSSRLRRLTAHDRLTIKYDPSNARRAFVTELYIDAQSARSF
jgi:hypothetical protein